MDIVNDEINLKQLFKSIISIWIEYKKKFLILLFLILFISLCYFIKAIYSPDVEANFILKSKYVNYEQLEKIISKYNYFIKDPNHNNLGEKLNQFFNESKILRIKIKEIKKPEDALKNNEDRYKFYDLVLTYSVYSSLYEKNIQEVLLKDIQERAIRDNDIIEKKRNVISAIEGIDSLLDISYEAGRSYRHKLESNVSQFVLLDDIYKGLNELLNQKLNYENTLSLLTPENIVFIASPIIVSNKIEYPYVIFILAFGLWLVICLLWIGFRILFIEN